MRPFCFQCQPHAAAWWPSVVSQLQWGLQQGDPLPTADGRGNAPLEEGMLSYGLSEVTLVGFPHTGGLFCSGSVAPFAQEQSGGSPGPAAASLSPHHLSPWDCRASPCASWDPGMSDLSLCWGKEGAACLSWNKFVFLLLQVSVFFSVRPRATRPRSRRGAEMQFLKWKKYRPGCGVIWV